MNVFRVAALLERIATIVVLPAIIETGEAATTTVTPTLPPTVTPVPTCVGDCDDGGAVTIDELIIGLNIALEIASIDQCAALDSDASRT